MDWIKRAAVIKSSITAGQAARDTGQSTSRFGADLSSLREQAEFVEDEPAANPWWRRVGGRNVVFGVLALVMIALVFWAAILSVQSLFNVTSASMGQTLAEPDLTATWAALGLYTPTQTADVAAIASLPTETSIPTETPQPTQTWTPIPNTPTPTQSPVLSPTEDLAAIVAATLASTSNPYTCQENQAYTYEIVRGPILVPEMGYEYSASTAPSLASAGWILRNTSPCTWESVLLLSVSSNRLLVPYIRQNGVLITEDSTSQAVTVPPSGEIEVGLAFPLYMARSIRSEWAVVINNFRLTDRPHLLLDINNWVLGMNISPTRTTSDRPSGSGDRDNDDEPPPSRP
jgi:hypothetical protein